MAQDKSDGINGKFVKTFAPGSSEHLAIVKLDELIVKFQALLAKLDADAGVADVNYASTLNVSKTATDQLVPSPAKQDV